MAYQGNGPAGDWFEGQHGGKRSFDDSGTPSFRRRHPADGEDDFEHLKQAALERVHPHLRSRMVVFPIDETTQVQGGDKVEVVRVDQLKKEARTKLVQRALATSELDNETFLRKVQQRMERVGIEFVTVEVRFENLTIDTDVYVGSRANPSLINSVRNFIQDKFCAKLNVGNTKRKLTILKDVSGVIKPGRLTLLLGPPGAGKTTLLKALCGKLNTKDMRVHGPITYNGHSFHEFEVQRTAAYIEQTDNHIAELTVRETLDFAARCQGVGHKFENLKELVRREHEQGIKPDPAIEAFMKASSIEGQKHSIVTEYMLRLLGLDVCADTVVGNQMLRGISGGQRKRVTTGEMIVGPKKTLFMDEISTGLDSSTTFSIVKATRNFVHYRKGTVLMALLQPAPETFELFDDIMLMAEGHIVYHGPREEVMPFFESLGFKLPERKGIADFLQEVTSRKDQEQYWAGDAPYRYISVASMAETFRKGNLGQKIKEELTQPYDRSASLPGALVQGKYALPPLKLLRATLRRELILMSRNRFLFAFRTFQVFLMALITCTLFFRTTLSSDNLNDGTKYLGVLFFSLIHMMFNGYSEMSLTVERLPVFYKQRDNRFFPAWAFAIPTTLTRLPFSIVEAVVWTGVIYYVVGLAPGADRFFLFMLIMLIMHQMAVSMFRVIGSIGRTMVITNTLGSLAMLVVFCLGGFVLSHGSIPGWWVWGYWVSPLSYAQNAISVNEFTAPRWQQPYANDPSMTVGEAILNSRDIYTSRVWTWIGIAVLICYAIVFNLLVMLAITYLSTYEKPNTTIPKDEDEVDEINERVSGKPTNPKAIAPSPVVINASSAVTTTQPQDGAVAINMEEFHDALALPPPLSKYSSRSTVAPFKPASRNPLSSNPLYDVEAAAPLQSDNPLYVADAAMPTPTGASATRVSHGGAGVGGEAGGEPKGPTEHASRNGAKATQGGMILPFKPLALTFHHITYTVQADGKDLPLLRDVSGAFRPGVLTALVGVSGAGKTTLMDVLAGRKTGGKIDGDILIDGHPKEQRTFARISGYVEQNDIHSPRVTVRESLVYSAKLRLSSDTGDRKLHEFVDEVMGLVELDVLQDSIVGLPGQSGLSVEQRKRLTIAVELVANPSIVFMDEPTSGLDARAAAIVMRTVRNTVNTGRTVVCTIHQPSIDIFESFDELLLMKRGGQVSYFGPLGERSCDLIDYFQSVPGVKPIREGYNPATWMLEVSTAGQEEHLKVDFADIYRNSGLYKRNEKLIEELGHPKGEPLHFESEYSRSEFSQFFVILWKYHLTYWRSPQYNTVRYLITIIIGLFFGSAFWGVGSNRGDVTNIFNIMGALYAATLFLGVNNSSTVQPVVAVERSVYYRERAAGMYGSLPYGLAQQVIEIPYVLGQTILYSAITYSMIQFEWTAAKFFWYLLFSFLTQLYFTYYGIMAVALTPSVQLAAVLSSFFYSFWNLFSGFLITRTQMPGWWVWYYYIDPVAWTLYGLVASQLGDVTNLITPPGGGAQTTVQQWLHDYFGFDHSFIGVVAGILCGFVILFTVVTLLALKRFNFQKR